MYSLQSSFLTERELILVEFDRLHGNKKGSENVKICNPGSFSMERMGLFNEFVKLELGISPDQPLIDNGLNIYRILCVLSIIVAMFVNLYCFSSYLWPTYISLLLFTTLLRVYFFFIPSQMFKFISTYLQIRSVSERQLYPTVWYFQKSLRIIEFEKNYLAKLFPQYYRKGEEGKVIISEGYSIDKPEWYQNLDGTHHIFAFVIVAHIITKSLSILGFFMGLNNLNFPFLSLIFESVVNLNFITYLCTSVQACFIKEIRGEEAKFVFAMREAWYWFWLYLSLEWSTFDIPPFTPELTSVNIGTQIILYFNININPIL
jgi:hypothetical protein